MSNWVSVFVLVQVCFFNGGFSLESSPSYQMDLMDSSKLVGSLLENFEKEAQILEQDFSLMSSREITPKENCDGNYSEILNKIASLATKLNTSVSVELKENWSSSTHVVLDHDGRVIFLTKNDSTPTTNENIAVLENPINYTKEVSFKLNEKLSVKIGILENNNFQKSAQSKSIILYLFNEVLLEFFSNIWFVLRVILVICTIYVLEML